MKTLLEDAMNVGPMISSRLVRWIAAPLLILMSAIVVSGGFHNHSDANSHDACAICTAISISAVTTGPVAAPAEPSRDSERILPVRMRTVFRLLPATASSRAPPVSASMS